ncbi:MAG: hypothetical protein WD823_13190 [Sulfuricaulis sp.]|uniref:hypothetical protein n=1 Tax=Sulfuricaulis sp. TaxID=2003553 RepID=UPI0034A444D4
MRIEPIKSFEETAQVRTTTAMPSDNKITLLDGVFSDSGHCQAKGKQAIISRAIQR